MLPTIPQNVFARFVKSALTLTRRIGAAAPALAVVVALWAGETALATNPPTGTCPTYNFVVRWSWATYSGTTPFTINWNYSTGAWNTYYGSTDPVTGTYTSFPQATLSFSGGNLALLFTPTVEVADGGCIPNSLWTFAVPGGPWTADYSYCFSANESLGSASPIFTD